MFRERNVGRGRVIPTSPGPVLLSLLVGMIVLAGCTTHRDLDSASGSGTAAGAIDGATTTVPASFITLAPDSGVLITSPPAGQTLPPLVPPDNGSSATSLASSSPPVPPTSIFTVSTTLAPTPNPAPKAPVPTPTTRVASSPTCTAKGSTGGVGNDAGALSTLVGADIRVGLHECFERIVIELRGDGTFPGFSVGYGDASVAGSAALLITLGSSMAGGGTGYSGATDIVPSGFAFIKELRLASDSNGQMVWAIGLDQQRKFVVSHLSDPARLVVDIQN